VTAVEEHVLGLEHPIDSLEDRINVLEGQVFGGVSDRTPTGKEYSVPERISNLESAVYSRAAQGFDDLPDGMSTFLEEPKRGSRISKQEAVVIKPSQSDVDEISSSVISRVTNGSLLGGSIGKPVKQPAIKATNKYVNPYATPGYYHGYPYVYRGPGLPPYAYGNYPGSPNWFNSPYQQSGATFYNQYPYFPWAANRTGFRAK
jgi:hypothetical protein